uniref:Uncharacterized protein n=1 Tax=Wuchereria bancrofti TaxID=6293 RepID=A0AAF5PZN7_WUCBA
MMIHATMIMTRKQNIMNLKNTFLNHLRFEFEMKMPRMHLLHMQEILAFLSVLI